MTKHELLIRQQRLLVRNAELRVNFAHQIQVLRKPLLLVEQVQWGVQWLSKNPIWPIGALLMVALLRPRRALAWGGRLWLLFKTIKNTKKWIFALPKFP